MGFDTRIADSGSFMNTNGMAGGSVTTTLMAKIRMPPKIYRVRYG
jgi:hypothetical protein